jgi:phenylalanyl-tRNA synthetase beta chain
MKFSYSWLQDLSGYKGTPEKLAEVLSSHAFETEVISGTEFKNIIVAKVTKVAKHPNADRLRVIELTDGTNTYGPVVCGAWNFDVGALVALALPGATIPHNQHDPEGKSFVLTKATIRGLESQGMICSGKELGISDDGNGILLLSGREYKPGETFTSKGGEVYLDISAPANRPDLLGYYGVALEIAALTGSKLNIKHPKIDLDKLKPKLLKVNISSLKLCPRYVAVRLNNLAIQSSPEFIQERIRFSGHRPINNIVDITNYVMLETGQPLHAFDAQKIQGPISVRTAYVNEKIVSLDGVERKLSPQNLVIADSKQAIGVAGVIGGANSMIDEFTTEIILESANFDGVSIRKTARELGLRTDAAVRFEKSLPLALTDFAAAYAVELLQKYAAAVPLETYKAGTKPPPLTRVAFDPDKINNLLGLTLLPAEQKKILGKFGYAVQGSGHNMSAVVPFRRPDVTIWQDLAEEIGRFVGLDEIHPATTSVYPSFEMTSPMVDERQRSVETLTGLGFDEIYTYSFISEKDLEIWDIEKKIVLTVANPLSSDQQYMRPNILINMMKAAEHNSRFNGSGNYFEIGNIYWKEGKHLMEKTYLGMISFDKDYPVLRITSSFRELAKRMNVAVTIEQDSEQMATIKAGKEVLGHIGRVQVGDLNWVGVHLDYEMFIKHASDKTFKPIIRYPSVELDVAVFARRDLAWGKIEHLIRSMDDKIIKDVELFDVYTGKNVPINKKSMAFRIVYQSVHKTLTDAEVQAVHSEVLKELKSKLNLEVR